MSNKTSRSLESKEIKDLWIKVMNMSELNFFLLIPFHGTPCIISLITGWTVYTEKYEAQGPDV